MTTPRAATNASPRPGRWRGRLLLALLGVGALAQAAAARAEEVCHAEYRAGPSVWYAVETQPRVSTVVDSGCVSAAGGRPGVSFFVRGTREVIACDLELAIPAAMTAELGAAQVQGATALPTRQRTLAATWKDLVRKHSPELPCAAGFQRMSDTSSGVPSVWCRKQLTAAELCPAGSAFADGVCTATACPDGTVELERTTGGRLAGCFRCPAGQLDLEESVAWRDQPSWSSTRQGPVTAVLCKARAADPCPDLRGAAPSPVHASAGVVAR
jgi:hypothetical protein